MVQWSILHASNAGGTGSIPGHGTKIPPAAWCGQTKQTTKKTYLKKSKIVATSGTERVMIRMWHTVGVARAGGKILIPDLRQGYKDVCFRVTQ